MKGGIVSISAAKDFSDFTFKEKAGNYVSLQEVFLSEKREEALIAFHEIKAEMESAKKPSTKKDGKRSKSEEVSDALVIRMAIKRIIKYTPSRESKSSKGAKRPQSASKGKSTGKKSGTFSAATFNKKDSERTMGEFKKYLEWFNSKDHKKLLGKRPNQGGDKPSAKRTK